MHVPEQMAAAVVKGPGRLDFKCSGKALAMEAGLAQLKRGGTTGPQFTKGPSLNHVAMSLSPDEPDEVDLIEPTVEEFAGALRLHSFYVGYRLPLMVETQHFEYLF